MNSLHLCATHVFSNGVVVDVQIHWKIKSEPTSSELPDNFQLSADSLHGLLHRLKQEAKILIEYDSIILDKLSKGIIEVVSTDEDTPEVIHYISHHAVVAETSQL